MKSVSDVQAFGIGRWNDVFDDAVNGVVVDVVHFAVPQLRFVFAPGSFGDYNVEEVRDVADIDAGQVRQVVGVVVGLANSVGDRVGLENETHGVTWLVGG